jgi:hypothetical protein
MAVSARTPLVKSDREGGAADANGQPVFSNDRLTVAGFKGALIRSGELRPIPDDRDALLAVMRRGVHEGQIVD